MSMFRVSAIAAVISFAVTFGLPVAGAMNADVLTAAQDALKHKQYDKAIALLTAPATEGDMLAQLYLGSAYEGRGRSASDAEAALDWYRKSADGGHPEAAVFAGDMLHWGKGTPVDETQAVVYYRKAADSQNASGMLRLAQMLEEGRGVARDVPAAIQLYRQTDHLLPGASFRLDGMILRQDGRDIDPAFQGSLCYAYALAVQNAVEVGAGIAKSARNFWVRVRPPPICSIDWMWTDRERRKARALINGWVAQEAESTRKTAGAPMMLPARLEAIVEGNGPNCLKARRSRVSQQGPKLTLKSGDGPSATGAIFGNRIVVSTSLDIEQHHRLLEFGRAVAYGEWKDGSAVLNNTLGTCKIIVRSVQ